MPAAVLEAIDLVERVSKRQARARLTAPFAKRLEKAIAKAFRVQGRAFTKRFKKLEKAWPVAEASKPEGPEWEPLFDAAAAESIELFQDPIDDATKRALAAGGKQMMASFSTDIAFDLKNPRAVKYIKNRGAEMVTKINETTRKNIRRIMTQAIDEGWSYDRAARAISDKYTEFAVGRPQQHIESRAHLVSVTETGNAYCEANLEAARQLADAGLEMEKEWITVGDDRVSEGCSSNEAQGWIPLKQQFDSGDDAPLAHPACRCSLGTRAKPEEKRKTKAA